MLLVVLCLWGGCQILWAPSASSASNAIGHSATDHHTLFICLTSAAYLHQPKCQQNELSMSRLGVWL